MIKPLSPALVYLLFHKELEMERGIEDFEKQCYEKINITLRNNEAQEDQDDSIICDVCRSVSFFYFYFISLSIAVCLHST